MKELSYWCISKSIKENVYLRETAHEWTEEQKEAENPRQSPGSARSWQGARNHNSGFSDLSQNRESDAQMTEPRQAPQGKQFLIIMVFTVDYGACQSENKRSHTVLDSIRRHFPPNVSAVQYITQNCNTSRNFLCKFHVTMTIHSCGAHRTASINCL